jgi:hypothetical protein
VLVLVVFDVCAAKALDTVPSFADRSVANRPVLVGLKMDQEYWRRVTGEPP